MQTRRSFVLSTGVAACGAWLYPPALAAAEAGGPQPLDLSPARRESLRAALADEDRKYDPAERMLAGPLSSPGYHTKLKEGQVHGTRASLVYAAALLDTGEPERIERAKQIIDRLVSLQDQNPESKTYGIWSWFLEEPLDKMSPPDWNWADFCSVQLLHAWIHHRDRLGAALAERVRESILHAARSIKKRNVGPGYTNIAIMGTYVSLVTGEQFEAREFTEYGKERLRRFHSHTFEQGSFTEYNSPTYTAVAIAELSRMLLHVRDAADRKLIEELHDFAWKHVAVHFHAPTRQWAGPHSRSYGDDLRKRGNALALIEAATGIDMVEEKPLKLGLDLYRLPLACPKEQARHFASLDAPRIVVETFSKADPGRRGGKNPIRGTTYLHPQFALGTVNRGDLWNQRRPVLAYWGSVEKMTWFRLRFLHDGYDYTSALVFSAQDKGAALVTVCFATDYGDTHPSLDRPKVPGRIRARDMRLRFELGGDTDGARIQTNGHGFVASDEGSSLTVRVAAEAFDGFECTWKEGREEGKRFVDRVVYSGEERTFDFNEMKNAFFAMALLVDPRSDRKVTPPSVRLDGELVQTSWMGITLSAPRKPAPLSKANDAMS